MLHPIKVRQLSSLKGKKIDNEFVIYIGRENHHLLGSVLENTYPLKIYKTRKRSLYLYTVWINKAIEARHDEYRELLRILKLARQHEVILACYCVDSDFDSDPIYCHGQIIRRALIKLNQRLYGE